MKKANLYLKIYFVVVGILCIIFGVFFISLWYEDHKNTKYKMEVRRILDEGYRSDEIYIIKSISPEYNYYELYLTDFNDEGRCCVLENVNTGEFEIINDDL